MGQGFSDGFNVYHKVKENCKLGSAFQMQSWNEPHGLSANEWLGALGSQLTSSTEEAPVNQAHWPNQPLLSQAAPLASTESHIRQPCTSLGTHAADSLRK